jgi:hypothetical protein
MNNKDIQTLVQSTLETCMRKMAAKLEQSFNPDDPKTIKLLQQLRATLSSWRMLQKQKQAETQTGKKPSNAADSKEFELETVLNEAARAIKKQTKLVEQKFNKPSGLMMPDPKNKAERSGPPQQGLKAPGCP